VPQRIDGSAGVVERFDASGLHSVIAARTSGADRRAGSEARGEQPLVLETLERRVHGAGRNIAIEAFLNFLQDRAPVRIVAQADDGQQHCLLECAAHVGHL